MSRVNCLVFSTPVSTKGPFMPFTSTHRWFSTAFNPLNFAKSLSLRPAPQSHLSWFRFYSSIASFDSIKVVVNTMSPCGGSR